MNRFLIAVAAAAFAVTASAQLYKWVDKDGKVFYSDTPPPDKATTQITVPKGPPAEPPRTAVQKDKELEKGRKAESDAAKKADEAAKTAAKNEQACESARQRHSQFSAGGRLLNPNPSKPGEREFMTDEQIRSGLEKARKDVEELCKKS